MQYTKTKYTKLEKHSNRKTNFATNEPYFGNLTYYNYNISLTMTIITLIVLTIVNLYLSI